MVELSSAIVLVKNEQSAKQHKKCCTFYLACHVIFLYNITSMNLRLLIGSKMTLSGGLAALQPLILSCEC